MCLKLNIFRLGLGILDDELSNHVIVHRLMTVRLRRSLRQKNQGGIAGLIQNLGIIFVLSLLKRFP
jgi:hypothetical protein